MDVNVSQKEFIQYFRNAHKKWLMDDEEYEAYRHLPEKITVYRGVGTRGKVKGLSWTTNIEKAKWFANRWGDNGKVYRGVISKDAVLAYFLRRDEAETVIDYSYLTDVEEVPMDFDEGDSSYEQ